MTANRKPKHTAQSIVDAALAHIAKARKPERAMLAFRFQQMVFEEIEARAIKWADGPTDARRKSIDAQLKLLRLFREGLGAQ